MTPVCTGCARNCDRYHMTVCGRRIDQSPKTVKCSSSTQVRSRVTDENKV